MNGAYQICKHKSNLTLDVISTWNVKKNDTKWVRWTIYISTWLSKRHQIPRGKFMEFSIKMTSVLKAYQHWLRIIVVHEEELDEHQCSWNWCFRNFAIGYFVASYLTIYYNYYSHSRTLPISVEWILLLNPWTFKIGRSKATSVRITIQGWWCINQNVILMAKKLPFF